MRPRIPVTVLSGFLGSGKTTLLCGLLEQRREQRLAVLINEIGAVSIDGVLARARSSGPAAAQIVDFSNGLIAYADDDRFVPTLQALSRRSGRVDHVLIETSGVALPSAAMARLQSAELSDDFVLDATLVVVDTPRLLAGELDAADAVERLFEQQLVSADVVVLNKIDDLAQDSLLVAEAQVRRRAPNVRFLELAQHATLDPRVALGLRLHEAGMAATPRHFHGPFAPLPGQPLTDHRRLDGHSHSGLLAHEHGLATHTHFHEQDPGWLSFTLRSDVQQNVATLRAALEAIAAAEPLLRCKGFVRSAAADRPILLQGVRTRVLTTASTSAVPLEASELVFIGYHLARSRVASRLSELTGTAWS
jgi:cobalamin biosynthesis protein CobW